LLRSIGVRPCDIARDGGGWAASILGKSSKPGKVAISASLAAELPKLLLQFKIAEMDKIFPIRPQAIFRMYVTPVDRAGAFARSHQAE